MKTDSDIRHTWSTSPWTVILISLGAVVLGGFVIGEMQYRSHRHAFERAAEAQLVEEQLNAHEARIAQLLSAGARSPTQLEDAIYEELQHASSNSSVTRDMVRVRKLSDDSWECIIDLSSIGMEPRSIRPAPAP